MIYTVPSHLTEAPGRADLMPCPRGGPGGAHWATWAHCLMRLCLVILNHLLGEEKHEFAYLENHQFLKQELCERAHQNFN